MVIMSVVLMAQELVTMLAAAAAEEVLVGLDPLPRHTDQVVAVEMDQDQQAVEVEVEVEEIGGVEDEVGKKAFRF